MTLFIPRKQNMVAPNIIDDAKEMANNPTARPNPAVIPGLGDPIGRSSVPSTAPPSFGQEVDPHHLEQVLRQNFLAIQNWANQRGVGASVTNTGATQTITATTYFTAGFGLVNWDFNSIANSATASLVLPENGVWSVTATGQFLNLPASTNMVVDMLLVTTTSQISTSWDHAHHNIQGGFDNLGFAATILVSTAPATYQVLARMQGVTPSSSNPPTFSLVEFSANKLFDKPSKVQ